MSLLSRFADLSVARGVIDVGGESVKPRTVPFRPDRATRIMGRTYAPDACLGIFARLGFPVADDDTETWSVTVPTHRFDIEREIDWWSRSPVVRVRLTNAVSESKAPEFSGRPLVDVQRAFDLLRGRGLAEVHFSFSGGAPGRSWCVPRFRPAARSARQPDLGETT